MANLADALRDLLFAVLDASPLPDAVARLNAKLIALRDWWTP